MRVGTVNCWQGDQVPGIFRAGQEKWLLVRKPGIIFHSLANKGNYYFHLYLGEKSVIFSPVLEIFLLQMPFKTNIYCSAEKYIRSNGHPVILRQVKRCIIQTRIHTWTYTLQANQSAFGNRSVDPLLTWSRWCPCQAFFFIALNQACGILY